MSRPSSGKGGSSSRTAPKQPKGLLLPPSELPHAPMTRSRIKREVEFIEESSKMAEGNQSRKRLISRPPRAVSPVSIETISEETGPTTGELTSGISPVTEEVIGTSSRTPPSGTVPDNVNDWAGGAPVEAFVQARVSVAVNDLITQILPLELPVDRVLVRDSDISLPLMRKFLRAAFDRGTPSYADFVLRANSFLSGLISLDIDASSFFTIIQELGKLLITMETVQKLRAETPLCSEAAAVHTLRAQYWEAIKDLEEVQDTCHILREQHESLDLEAIVARHEMDDLRHQLANAQARLESMNAQRTQLGLELEAQKKEGDLRAARLTKLRHDRDHAQASSDRAVQLYDSLNQLEIDGSKKIEEMITPLLQS